MHAVFAADERDPVFGAVFVKRFVGADKLCKFRLAVVVLFGVVNRIRPAEVVETAHEIRICTDTYRVSDALIDYACRHVEAVDITEGRLDSV